MMQNLPFMKHGGGDYVTNVEVQRLFLRVTR